MTPFWEFVFENDMLFVQNPDILPLLKMINFQANTNIYHTYAP